MKIKEGFVLREVAGQTMVIAVGEANKIFKGMIKMNGTAKDIWQYIEQDLDVNGIIKAMVEKYDAPESQIKDDVLKIISIMKQHHIVEE